MSCKIANGDCKIDDHVSITFSGCICRYGRHVAVTRRIMWNLTLNSLCIFACKYVPPRVCIFKLVTNACLNSFTQCNRKIASPGAEIHRENVQIKTRSEIFQLFESVFSSTVFFNKNYCSAGRFSPRPIPFSSKSGDILDGRNFEM